VGEKLYSLAVGCSLQEEELHSGSDLGGSTPGQSPYPVTILFIPLSAPAHKLETDWARDCDKISSSRTWTYALVILYHVLDAD
jgi:hypothetical protein